MTTRDLEEQAKVANRRLREIGDELQNLETVMLSEDQVSAALADFDALWDVLTSREQSRIIELPIERIEMHAGRLDITFHPTGIKAFATEREEVAA